MTPIICSHFNKKDARALSKAEVDQLEYLKLCILTGMKPFVDVTPELVKQLIEQNTKPSKAFRSIVKDRASSFSSINARKPNTSELRHIHASVYAEISCFW